MTKDKRIHCVCSECGIDYEMTFDSGNPYFCPKCDEAKKARISASFREIAGQVREDGQEMTKTKCQLRTEAVERLEDGKNKDAFYRSILNDAVEHGVGMMTCDQIRDALIDLLTDDEPPEGDVVQKLRAEQWGPIGRVIADMVERDYVLRSIFDAVCKERDKAVEAYDAHMEAHDAWHEAEDIKYTRNRFAVYEQATKEHIAKLALERDELEVKLQETEFARDQAMELADEWKAKAERSKAERSGAKSNLEWLYESTGGDGDSFRCRVATLARPYYLDAHDDIDERGVIAHLVDEWLMSEHVDEPQVMPDAEFEDPDTDTSVSVHMGDLCPNDTREKLEADVLTLTIRCGDYSGNYAHVYGSVMYAQIKELLDRQAAITDAKWRHVVDGVKAWRDEIEHAFRYVCDYLDIDHKTFSAEDCAKEVVARFDKMGRALALTELKASEDYRPKCDTCDRETLLLTIEDLESRERALKHYISHKMGVQGLDDLTRENSRLKKRCDDLQARCDRQQDELRRLNEQVRGGASRWGLTTL